MHAVVVGYVAGSSVVEAAPGRVVVLLFLNQQTTSDRLSAPRLDPSRVRMIMERREMEGNRKKRKRLHKHS